MTTRPSRLLLLGIDSMNLGFVREHLDRLPTLRRLLAASAPRTLQSPADVASASVWPTFASGELPGHHGEYFPFQWDAATMSFRRTDRGPWADQFAYDPFWFRLARRGVPCVVFDAAHIGRSRDVPCVQIVNWSYQSSGAAFSDPPELLSELRRRFGRRPIGPEVPVPKKRRRTRALRDQLLRAVEAKGDAILWMAERQPWRFYLAAMYEVHRAGHNLWPVDAEFASEAEPDAMLEVYAATDRQLGRILERFDDGETAGVVFALSGMEANRAQNHFLPEVLARLSAAWRERGGGEAPPRPRASLVAALRRLAPFELQYHAARLLGERIQDWVVDRTLRGGLDWRTTPAFALSGGGEGYIRLNVRGRERDGCLDAVKVPEFAAWLEGELREIRVVPGGAPLVAEIVRLGERYPGPKASRLPDLAVRWAPAAPATRIASPTLGEIEARLETGRGGNHTADAFAIFWGPDPGAGIDSEVARVEDLSRYCERFFAP